MSLLQSAVGALWGGPMAAALLAVGAFFTLYLGAFPFRRPGFVLKCTVGSLRRGSSGSGLTPFQSVCTALSASVGTGNIAGVAAALTLGGAGAVFWMWVAALLGMCTGFAENVLGVRYRRRLPDGRTVGGPMYYMADGLHAPRLGTFYALLCLFAALGVGCLVQGGSIVSALSGALDAPKLPISLLLAAVTAAVMLGGSDRIGRVAELLVPAMVGAFLLAGSVCLIRHARQVPAAFALIVRSAFTPRAAAGGGFLALRYGVSRGVFSNEAGLGSGVMAHAGASGVTPLTQGLWSVVEIGLDTLVICTMTALVILTSGAAEPGLTGAALTASAFTAGLGAPGGWVVTLCLTLFAFSTILGWGHFAGVAAEFCFGPRAVPVMRALMIVFVALGGVVESDAAWLAADLCNGLMAVPNLAALVLLRREVKAALPRC